MDNILKDNVRTNKKHVMKFTGTWQSTPLLLNYYTKNKPTLHIYITNVARYSNCHPHQDQTQPTLKVDVLPWTNSTSTTLNTFYTNPLSFLIKGSINLFKRREGSMPTDTTTQFSCNRHVNLTERDINLVLWGKSWIQHVGIKLLCMYLHKNLPEHTAFLN